MAAASDEAQQPLGLAPAEQRADADADHDQREQRPVGGPHRPDLDPLKLQRAEVSRPGPDRLLGDEPADERPCVTVAISGLTSPA